ESLVFSPVHARFIPSHPGTPAAVYGDGGVRLELRARRQRLQGRQLAVLIRAKLNVVVALVVGIPGDVGGSIRARGDGRLPIVGRRLADADLLRPLPGCERTQENVALAAAVTLPDHENLPIRRGRSTQERIRSFRRQPLGHVPRRALLLPSP